MTIREWLAHDDAVLFRDGAMGSLLLANGLVPGHSPEEWNVLYPERIRDIHDAYARAGANLILSNTLGGNRMRLKHSKYGVRELVDAGVRLAKAAADAAPQPCSALLDVGPLGCLLEPLGDLEPDEAVELFSEAVTAGANAGADGVLIETMGDLAEAGAAVRAARACSDLPVIVTMSFDQRGRLFTGVPAAAAAAALDALGVDALGMNCGVGPDGMLPLLPAFIENTKKPVAACPNAGLPRLAGDRAVYDTTPDAFAERMEQFFRDGARLLGGCCGTTPAHIEAMVRRIRALL